MDEPKALMPVAAKAQDPDEEAAWFAGKVPRRILSIPFGGPIPSSLHPRGVDLDGDTFTERTDIFGPHRALRQTRERLVDWSHAAQPPGPNYGDPSGMMTGHVFGKSILDPDPDEDGWWSDLWFEMGNKRVALIESLKRRGATLFGSSQPYGRTAKSQTGEITLWPHLFQTLTTAPQNTHAVLRPKAALDMLSAEPDRFWSDIEVALRSLGSSLRESSDRRALIEAKAGRVLSASNEADLKTALDDFERALGRVRTVLSRQSQNATGEEREPNP